MGQRKTHKRNQKTHWDELIKKTHRTSKLMGCR